MLITGLVKLQGDGAHRAFDGSQFVKPYVKTNKNDAADAAAICEAVTRPSMRFVPIRTWNSKACSPCTGCARVCQGPHRPGQPDPGLAGRVRADRPAGIGHISERVPQLIEDACNELPGAFRCLIQRLLEHLKGARSPGAGLEAQIVAWHRQSDLSRKLEQIPGIGPITAQRWWPRWAMRRASNGRQVAAWLGLVPRQHSSGGKQNLLASAKRGDTYLRTLLIHGARSAIYHAQNKGLDSSECCYQRCCPAAQQERSGGGTGQQECPHRVGLAGARALLRAGLRTRAGLSHKTGARAKTRKNHRCSSNHEVMARQVRPWWGNPIRTHFECAEPIGPSPANPIGDRGPGHSKSDIRVQSLPSWQQ